MKKLSMMVAVVAAMAGTAMGAQLVTGGNIPVVNNMIGIGVISLDFSGPGNAVDIAQFIINNNTNSWDVTWNFANQGNFKKNVGELINMTTLTVEPSTQQPAGTWLGTGAEPLLPTADWGTKVPGVSYGGNMLLPLTGGLTPVQQGDVVYSPTDQTDATTNYAITMKASWGDASHMLAGLYTEVITFSITYHIN